MTATMEMTRARVLVVDDKESVLEIMERILGDSYDVTATPDATRAMALVGEGGFDLVLTDIRMPEVSGFELLAAAQRCAQPPRVVMITGFARIPDAVAAIRQGAFDYIAKPLEAEEISLVVARALHDALPDPEGAPHPPSDSAASRSCNCAGGGAARAGELDSVDTVFHDAVAAARDRASRDYLVALMKQYRGNVTEAARRAAMTRESLHRLLRKYDVHSQAFRGGLE
jgi:DNA-binding NtrC family response regulator